MNRIQAKRKINACIKLLNTTQTYISEIGSAMEEVKAVDDDRYKLAFQSVEIIKSFIAKILQDI